jgi:acyl-CoA thioesterase FadM
MHSANPEKTKPTERNFENCVHCRDSLFALKRIVTLGKTHALGGAYFAEFFVWTGEAREELLAQAGQLVGIIPHTSEARMKYLRELHPFDAFEIIVWPRAQAMSLSLRFFFVRDSDLIAVGDQEMCLKSNGKIIPIPAQMAEFIAKFDPQP